MKDVINARIESCRQWMMRPEFWYAILLCYLAVLGFLSLNPWVRPRSTDAIFSPDKLEHALAYGGLAIIVFHCIARSRRPDSSGAARAWLAAILISTLVGILIEVAQSLFTSNRVGSVDDAAANAIGAGLGFAAYHSVKYVHARICA
jgi:VanZ family protein